MHRCVRDLSCEPNECVSWSAFELRVRLVLALQDSFKTSFEELFCYSCFMLVFVLSGPCRPIDSLVCDFFLCFVTFL